MARAIFYTHQTSGACAGICPFNCMHEMDKTAPNVDIQTSAGDPLEYHFFVLSFREAVEHKIDDPHERLVWLLKFTDGEAENTIRHCI